VRDTPQRRLPEIALAPAPPLVSPPSAYPGQTLAVSLAPPLLQPPGPNPRHLAHVALAVASKNGDVAQPNRTQKGWQWSQGQ